MTLTEGPIDTWESWKRADAAMADAVTAVRRKKKAAKTPAELALARDHYDALLEQWAQLKSLGLRLVDREVASTELVVRVEVQTDKITKQANRIAALAKTLKDVAAFVAEVTKFKEQFDELLITLDMLTL